MFVSSYSTYIDTAVTKKVQNDKLSTPVKNTDTFSSKLLASSKTSPIVNSQLPLSYVSNYKALSNRQLLEQQESKQNIAQKKFSKLSAMSNSKVSYEENSKMFSFLIKPKSTIHQTPKLNKNLPPKAQESQESLMKIQMVNTYVANENYYKITAA